MLRDALILWRRTRQTKERSTSLQLRLFAFFSMFLLILSSVFALVLMLSGVFNKGKEEGRVFIETELEHLTESVSSDFGRLSVQGLALSRQLGTNIDLYTMENQLSIDQVFEDNDCLEELLGMQMTSLLSFLTNSQCSGAFIILNASITPDPQLRSGIFLKRTEPNAAQVVSSKLYCLRGPANIARNNSVELIGQWQMEFDISDSPVYTHVIETAEENPQLDLSRLYYWSDRLLLKGNSESGMLLCVPVTTRAGRVLGVCGLEVSSMLFKLMYSPDNSRFSRIFSTLSPMRSEKLNTDAGLIAGNSYLTNPATGLITAIQNSGSGFCSYRTLNGYSYTGMHHAVSLYPEGSPYSPDQWVMAVMVPTAEFDSTVSGSNSILFISILVLLALSLVFAVFISRQYISPVVNVLNRIKTDSPTHMSKTNIAEIDDLLKFLAAKDEAKEQLEAELEATRQAALTSDSHKDHSLSPVQTPVSPNLSAYEEFVKNIDTLSAAELAVFKLYMEGHTAAEIADILCLSMNTIKTHNRRIYTKLNVTSRKELMVFVQMMSQSTIKEGP